MSTRHLGRVPALLLLAGAVTVLALLGQSPSVRRAAAQAAATSTPTSTATATPTATTAATPGQPIIATGICGTITGFTPATSSAAGSITFSTVNQNQTLTIAPGTVLGNSAGIGVTSNVCLLFTLNSSNAITSGRFVSNSPVQIVVCGVVSQYTPATSSANGRLDIGGIALATALGASFTGGTPTVGQSQSITATLNGLGIITEGRVAAGNCPSGPTLSGPFSSFTPPTATTPGSVTFGLSTFPIAAGSNIKVSLGGVPLAATLVGVAMHNGATYFL